MEKLIANLNHHHSNLSQSLQAYSTAADFNRILDAYTAVLEDIEKIKAEISELKGNN
jgi:hypothetical protein